MPPSPVLDPHEAVAADEGHADRETSRAHSERTTKRRRRILARFMQRLARFLREIWRSLLMLVIVGAAAGAVSVAPHAFDRLFPVTFFSNSGDIVWVQYAYPYQRPIFSSLTAALVAILIPIGVILATQMWLRSFCNGASAILGLAYSLMTGTFFIVVLKKTIGGLRPHFLSVCEPVIPLQQVGTGYKNIMFTIQQVCTGKDKAKLGDAIESFPSGHSEIAFAGLFYLSIYLLAHLRIQSRSRVGYWRMVACLLPILLATILQAHWF